MTRFQEELARAAALPGLAPAGPALWPRFAGYYQGLTRLPGKARPATPVARSLGGLALLCALGQAPALAATINVGGACTLVDAITAASGADTLVLPAGSTHTLTVVNNSRLRRAVGGERQRGPGRAMRILAAPRSEAAAMGLGHDPEDVHDRT